MSTSTFYDESLDTSYLIEETALDEPTYDATPTHHAQESIRDFSQPATSSTLSASAVRPGPYLRRMNSGDLGRGSSRATPAGFTQPPLAPVRTTSAERATRKSVPVLAGSLSLHKDRFVPLPRETAYEHIPEETNDMEGMDSESSAGGALISPDPSRSGPGARHWGRITVSCIAEGFMRSKLLSHLDHVHPGCTNSSYPDAIYFSPPFSANASTSDVFFLDYGVVICWNLTELQEAHVLNDLATAFRVKPMPSHKIQVEELSFHYSAMEPPHIQNDVITINKWQASDPQVKLSISFALAQSCKLAVYEERIGQLVEEVRFVPEELAQYGEVRKSRNEVAKLTGKVFLQKNAVNLLSSILDTPEYFWGVPDSMQVLYDKVCEYRELEGRVEIVNARFEIMQKMLNIWSEHSQVAYMGQLDLLVVFLIVIEVVVAALEVVGLLFIHRKQ